MNSINHNLMAANVANNLNAHYGRLATSVQRLSSGLRINSAADDAAGLAIRELMRADVAALNQGARNANDAISMLQVADGALAIIDEKLIRMKELAEQAATGTYNSTQRLIIDSEYKAMADEIDRIARATDFNGIKLLDGSLSGAHNGKGLQSTGMMKIHFGSANDSAEDYYYVSIGACTSYALGLGGAGSPGGNQEVVSVIHKTFKPQTSYVEYVDPDTGNKYYSDGDFYFSNTNNPAGTALDWETDGQVIERLKTVQRTDISNVTYDVYVDPVTNIQYYKSHVGGSPYLLDPFNPQGGRLDSNRDKEIIDRLQDTRNGFGITLNWDVYLDPAGKRYYSCDNGKTFVPNTSRPSENVLDSRNPADNEIIKAFTPEMVIKYVTAPSVYIDYLDYVTPDPARPGNYKKYYSSDGGKTFVVDPNRPDLKLDPNDPYDKRLIDGMKPDYQTRNYTYEYEEYRDKTTGTIYYKSKQNNTYTLDKAKPDQIALDGNNPAHAAAIANLEPQTTPTSGAYKCDIYRDASSGKMYYTRDNGQTFFSDLRDMNGSVLNASHPDYYAGILNNMEKANGTAHVDVPAYRYNHPQLGTYYSADGGKTFVRWVGLTDLGNPELDINNPQDAAIINNMALSPDAANYRIEYDYYIDPVTGASYYQDVNGNGDTFCRDMSKPDVVALDRNNPADQAVIDRLVQRQKTSTGRVEAKFPESYLIYEDGRNGNYYYSYDGGQTFIRNVTSPYSSSSQLDPNSAFDKPILDNLRPVTATLKKTVSVPGSEGGATISTQEAAQNALVAVNRAIVSKDKIRAHLGALQNRLENTVTSLNIQAKNMQNAESRISDADIANEMTTFVRNQILTQSAVAMLGQANSYPHMLMGLING